MTFTIPSAIDYSFERDDEGIAVWAIQRGLNQVRERWAKLDEDGVYGEVTEEVVRDDFQRVAGLAMDGVFGPKSQGALAGIVCTLVEDVVVTPPGLVGGLINGESSGYIANVNWNKAGGVDCGYCQRRVYESDYQDQDAIKRAFDPKYQVGLAARTFRSRHDAFYGDPGSRSHERSWRLAALNHNYPYAAQELASGDWPSTYSNAKQDWVIAIGGHDEDGDPISVFYPDGKRVETPMDWCRYYALGAPAHDWNGLITKAVSVWPA